nr:excalibur calcium-binding domain-containing protein [Paraglaciecola sp. MB-3u-78]
MLVFAKSFIKSCPNIKMDGHNDGIPCENDSRF